MQSHDRNNKSNHACFVKCSTVHAIPMNTWQSCELEEEETPFSVAVDDSLRTSDVNIFLNHFVDIYMSSFTFQPPLHNWNITDTAWNSIQSIHLIFLCNRFRDLQSARTFRKYKYFIFRFSKTFSVICHLRHVQCFWNDTYLNLTFFVCKYLNKWSFEKC